MKTTVHWLLMLALSPSTGLFAQSLFERTTITPADHYIDVRFTKDLENHDGAIDLKKLEVTLKEPRLSVVKVHPLPGTFREIRIDYDGDLLPGSIDFEVCFGTVKLQDGSSKSDVCTLVFVSKSYSEAYEEQKQRLKQLFPSPLFHGVATSKTEKVLEDVKVHMAVVDPRTASDTFGRRIGSRFLVFQVTIGNVNDDFDYLVHDVLLRVPFRLEPGEGDKNPKPVICGPEDADCSLPEYAEISSLELSILRGVAERGQAEDRRNLAIRAIKGIGTIAAGLIGVTQLGKSYAPAVAGFNGPFTAAFESVFPDHTINQLNRLNTAWLANRVVPRDHSIVMVGFVPQALLFSRKQRKRFWKDSFEYLEQMTRVSVRVTGDFVAEVSKVPPALTTIAFEDAGKFRDATPIVKGFIVGQFLTNSELSLGTGGNGMTVEIDGAPTNDRIDFILRSEKPVAPNHQIEFVVKKNKVTRKYAVPVTYQARRPSISKIAPAEAVREAREIEVTVTGTDFLPGAEADTGGLEKVGTETLTGSTELKVKVKIAATTAAKKYHITVLTIGGRSNPNTFEVKLPAPTIDALVPAEAVQGAGEVEVKVTGENLVAGATISTDGLEKVGDETVISSTEMKVKVKVEADTTAKSYNFTVKTSGGTSTAKTFAIKPKP